MKITTLICAALAASAPIGQFAVADNPKLNPNINKRQHTQQARVESRELARKEAAERERRDLDQQLDQAGKEIREDKHDAPQR